MPIFRHTSDTDVPVSLWRSANAICSSVNFDFLMTKPLLSLGQFRRISLLLNGILLREEVMVRKG